MKPQNKKFSLSLARALSFALVAVSFAQAQTPDQRLRELAAHAESRAVWSQIRSLAEKSTDSEGRGRAYFVLGYREYEASEFASAARDMQLATETSFSLTDQSRYFWADAARAAGHADEAISALNDFSTRHPESTLRFPALSLLAKLLLENNQPEQAIQTLTTEPQVHRRSELAMLLAQAYLEAKRPKEAARIYQELYNAFPLAPQAKDAQTAIDKLRAELGSGFPEVSEEIQTARADLLAARGRWQDALNEYTRLADTRGGSTLEPRWNLGRARSLIRLRRPDEAVRFLGTPAAPALDAERLGLIIDARLQSSDLAGAQPVLDSLHGQYPQSPQYSAALSSFGNVLVRKGDWRGAAPYYEALSTQFPQTPAGREAHWRVAWSYYLDGDLTRAYQKFVDHLERYPDSDHATGALYWLGRIADQRGAAGESREVYQFLCRRYIHSYFAQRAAARLAEITELPIQKASATQPTPSVMPALAKLPERSAPALRACEEPVPSEALQPFLTLTSLHLNDLAEQYLDAKVKAAPAPPDLHLALGRLRAEEKKFALALFEAKTVVPRAADYEFEELPAEFWRLLYPKEYLALVRRNARAGGVEPALVLGLIRQESAFNPQATSSANARGLMQILPQTVSGSRKGRARAARRLYDPAFNIQFGVRHLAGLLKLLNDSPEQAMAAYHAGDLRVREWLGQRTFQEQPEFLESIPIPATRTYVEAVLRDAGIYRELLSGEAKLARCSAK